ncbi:acyltransferase family protein [Cryobacterium sp. SO1]|uniref:acyltransferase family protein n=1 Tax=Cryobacterium sp. SO1 TaxID=1897061 RepID=UPI001023A564|nr:acyltransferase family protein [Cryobacterium sp. SO1]RZI37107.1 hypothetical protein BJQ95_00449 [Cryobacterium sp. SO1]
MGASRAPIAVAAQQRIQWPDAARGMAIVLVVFHHAIIYSAAEGLAAPGWLAATEMLRTMRMPLFFLAAGLFAGKYVTGRWRSVFQKKILLFAWVFVLWVIVRWTVLNLIPGVDSETGILQLPLHLVWPVGGWFIFVLAIYFVLARCSVGIPTSIQLAVAGVASLLWFALDDPIGNNGWDGVPTFYFFFLVGCYGRSGILAFGNALSVASGIAVVAGWAASYVALAHWGLADAPVISFAMRVLGLGAGIALARGLERHRWLRRLGGQTLPIYLSHTLWIFFAVWILTLIWPGGDSSAAMWVPLPIALFGLAMAWLMARCVAYLGANWLFETPQWLAGMFDRFWPLSRPIASPDPTVSN